MATVCGSSLALFDAGLSICFSFYSPAQIRLRSGTPLRRTLSKKDTSLLRTLSRVPMITLMYNAIPEMGTPLL